MRNAVYLVLPFVMGLALGLAFFAMVRDRGAGGVRPWWGHPLLWLGLCALFAVLGLLVWPGLFGGFFLFLPFVWVRRGPTPRARDVDVRANGHGGAPGA